MKKAYKVSTLVVLAVLLMPLAALAGESKACGSSVKPSTTCEPCRSCERPGDYRRDVLDNKIPMRTESPGTWHQDEATGHREYILTGSENKVK